MKTLIFNGSPRKNGDTMALLHILTAELEGEFLLVNAYDGDIAPCIDCRFCRSNKGCAIDDGMGAVYDYLDDCDNIVIASPIYFNQPTGRLLVAASRLQTLFSAVRFRGEHPLTKPKKGGVILVGGGTGDPAKACETAMLLLHHMRARDIHPPVYSFGTDRLPAAEDKEAIAQVRSLAVFLNRTS